MLMYLSFSALPILNKIINKSPRLLNVLLAHMIGAGIQNYKKLFFQSFLLSHQQNMIDREIKEIFHLTSKMS